MKHVSLILSVLFLSATVNAASKIQFNQLIESGMAEKNSLSRDVEALSEGSVHNEEEQEVLNFVANEINLENESKLAEQNKAKDSTKKY